jgi:hypothetical protein
MKESDLYLPLKRFLELQNYEVKGEVQDCDVLAVRGKEAPVVVELKLSLNLDVVLQAVERLSLTSKVYIGGTDRRKGIMTVYRQRALAIARFLQKQGPTKAADIARTLREPKAREILYRNVYGWFDRVSLGVYELSPRGQQEIPLWRDEAENTISMNQTNPPGPDSASLEQ